MDKPEVLGARERIAEDHRSAALFEAPPPTGPSRGAYNALEEVRNLAGQTAVAPLRASPASHPGATP